MPWWSTPSKCRPRQKARPTPSSNTLRAARLLVLASKAARACLAFGTAAALPSAEGDGNGER